MQEKSKEREIKQEQREICTEIGGKKNGATRKKNGVSQSGVQLDGIAGEQGKMLQR